MDKTRGNMRSLIEDKRQRSLRLEAQLFRRALARERNLLVRQLLESVSNRKADSYVKLIVKMEDYYRIKDAEGGEMNG